MWGLPLPTALLQLKLPRPAFELLLALPLTNFFVKVHKPTDNHLENYNKFRVLKPMRGVP